MCFHTLQRLPRLSTTPTIHISLDSSATDKLSGRPPARLAAVTCKFWLTCSPTCSRAPCVAREHCLKITDDATFRSVSFPAALEPVASRLPPRIVPSCRIGLKKNKERKKKKKTRPLPPPYRQHLDPT